MKDAANERKFSLLDKVNEKTNEVKNIKQERDNIQNREEEKGSRIHLRCSINC